MTSTKYIGMDVHKESISIAVMNAVGKIVMECVIETKANMILQCIDGLRGDLHVTFEEGTSAAWLYDLLKPHVTELIVCDPRKNASMVRQVRTDLVHSHGLRSKKNSGRGRDFFLDFYFIELTGIVTGSCRFDILKFRFQCYVLCASWLLPLKSRRRDATTSFTASTAYGRILYGATSSGCLAKPFSIPHRHATRSSVLM